MLYRLYFEKGQNMKFKLTDVKFSKYVLLRNLIKNKLFDWNLIFTVGKDSV